MRFRLGELFCGPGGLALGAISADIGRDDCRIVHAWASDYDGATCETYRLIRLDSLPEYPYQYVHIGGFDINKAD